MDGSIGLKLSGCHQYIWQNIFQYIYFWETQKLKIVLSIYMLIYIKQDCDGYVPHQLLWVEGASGLKEYFPPGAPFIGSKGVSMGSNGKDILKVAGAQSCIKQAFSMWLKDLYYGTLWGPPSVLGTPRYRDLLLNWLISYHYYSTSIFVCLISKTIKWTSDSLLCPLLLSFNVCLKHVRLYFIELPQAISNQKHDTLSERALFIERNDDSLQPTFLRRDNWGNELSEWEEGGVRQHRYDDTRKSGGMCAFYSAITLSPPHKTAFHSAIHPSHLLRPPTAYFPF